MVPDNEVQSAALSRRMIHEGMKSHQVTSDYRLLSDGRTVWLWKIVFDSRDSKRDRLFEVSVESSSSVARATVGKQEIEDR